MGSRLKIVPGLEKTKRWLNKYIGERFMSKDADAVQRSEIEFVATDDKVEKVI